MTLTIGPYRVEREVARGANGVVLRALGPGGPVAIKLLLPERLRDPDDIERFHREGDVAARLAHRAIVPLLDRGHSQHGPYHVYAFVAGQTLRARIRTEGHLEPREAARIALELCEALEHAHGLGVLHRDLKPANVLLTPSGEPRLTDFGLAMDQTSGSRLTLSGEIMGSPVFMPPEQALGRRHEIGPASDVYGLGAVLYAMLTGHPPVSGRGVEEVLQKVRHGAIASPLTLAPETPPRLAAICMRCLEKHPGDRYPDMPALARDLRLALAPAAPPPRVSREAPWVAIGLGLGALVTLSVAGAWAWSRRRAPAPDEEPALGGPRIPLPGPEAPEVRAASLAAEALACLERADVEAAGRQARQALELDPACAEAHLALGRVHEDAGARVLALEAWGRAAALGLNVEPELAPLYPDPVERRLVWLTFVPEAGELAEAALLCTRLVRDDDELDAAQVLATLDRHAQDLRPDLEGLDGDARLEALVRLCHARVVKGETFAYYEPSKSELDRVLESGTGVHISCALVLIALGERLDVELQGVCAPGWFLVRPPGEPPRMINAHAGTFVSREDLQRLFADERGAKPYSDAALRAATRQEILFRLTWWQAQNLKNRGYDELAQRARDVALLLAMGDPEGVFRRAFGQE
ncbi:MAG: protein kinase [Planctomycetota bacterium]